MFDHHFPIGRWASIHASLLPLATDRGPIRGPVRYPALERKQLTRRVSASRAIVLRGHSM
jgi:hypothetical protein